MTTKGSAMSRLIIAAFAATLGGLVAVAAIAGPPRPVTYDVRDAEPEDVRSITLFRQSDGTWVETWTFVAYTSDEEPLGEMVFQQVVTGAPGVNQLNALVTARLAQLNAALDAKYPSGGPPQPLVDGGNGRGGGKP